MRMLACFWAGYLTVSYTAISDQEGKDKLEELKNEIKKEVMNYSANGSISTLMELCVNVIKDAELIAMYNFER